MSDLYNRIEELCKKNGVTVTLMCKNAGISRASLSDLKFGRTQTLSSATLGKISRYFNVSVDYLMGHPTEPQVSEEADKNVVRLAGRDGEYSERILSDEQLKMLRALIDQLPEAPGDL